MSTKEERPTLAGVNVKTRKRNIVVPSDPGSFADAIIHIFHDAGAAAGLTLPGGAAGATSPPQTDDAQPAAAATPAPPQQPLSTADVEKLLDAGAKALDGAELDFSRYADTLFEVLFAGGRLGTGGALADDQRLRLAACVLSCPVGDPAAIQPFIKTFQTLIRRRPFLVKGLENTLNRLILSLEFYDPTGRRGVASAAAAVFAQRIGCLPENVLTTLLNDRLVAKGTVLDFLTAFFRAFLDAAAAERATGGGGGGGGEGGGGAKAGGGEAKAGGDAKGERAAAAPVDDLVQLLVRARVADRLLEFTPPGKRTLEALLAHLRAEGLGPLADWAARREVDARVSELQEGLAAMMSADPPHPQSEVIAYVKRAKQEANLPDADVVRVLWTVLSRSVPMTGKNGQQVQQALLARVKANHKLLSAFVTSARLELSLIVALQVCCYEDSRLLKLFADVLRALYACDLVGEDAVQHWYRKGSHPKGRNVFLKDAEPFIKWLEEAEEEDDEEEEAEAVEAVAKAAEKLAV